MLSTENFQMITMSLSKHVDKINKIYDTPVEVKIPRTKILEMCKITYNTAISIEIIKHLFGGENMEYNVMELGNSYHCEYYCRQDLLNHLKQDKREIAYFEDRKNYSSSIIICLVKQPKTKAK